MRKTMIRNLVVCGLLTAGVLACSSGRHGADNLVAAPEITGGGAVFRYHDSEAKRVYLVGDFNNWSPYGDPMKDPDGDGTWELFYPLAPGTYSYKFIVDGKWIPDPHNPLDEPDGFGGRNSLVKIPVK